MKSYNYQIQKMHQDLRAKPLVVARELTNIAKELAPCYHPRFSLSLLEELSFIITEMDSMKMLDTMPDGEDVDEYIINVLQEIVNEITEYRAMMKEVMLLYKYEQAHNFGNRLLQLTDVLIGSFQTGLSREEVDKIYCFLEIELHKISLQIGGDY
jgi:hypothetical protein